MRSLPTSWIVILALIGALVSLAAASTTPEAPTTVPIPKINTYNVVFTDGKAAEVLGTEIRSTGSFCVEVLIGDRVDTVVCDIRYVTEALPPEKEEPDNVVPQRHSPRTRVAVR